MLHDHMQVFTSTVGTQTDPEIFYVNGKPARAVPPFRVIPKPKSVQTVLVQTEEDEEAQTEEQPHTSGWQQAQWTSSGQEPAEQENEVHEVELQSEQLEIEEQDQEDVQEVVQENVQEVVQENVQEVVQEDVQEVVQEEEVQESERPETEMQEPVLQVLQSQETQTELQHLQRQLLLLQEEEHAFAKGKW